MLKHCLFSVFILLSLSACYGQSTKNLKNVNNLSSSDCQTVQHERGETQVCGQPQRIIALNPKMLDILLSLEVQPIGYAEIFADRGSNFDQPSQQIPYLGDRVTQPIANLGISGQPSLEAIARIRPDLILGDSWGNEEEYAQLSQIAPTLLFEYVGADKWQEPLRTIASLLNRAEQAEAVIEAYQQQLESTRQTLTPVVESYPNVLMIASEQLAQSVDLITTDDFCGKLLKDLGFQLVSLSTDIPKDITQSISVEVLPRLDTDLIIVQGHNMAGMSQIENVERFSEDQVKPIQQSWSNNPVAQSLTATKANRVYFVPTYLCRGVPSPTGAELILKQLQTELSPLMIEGTQR
jgi:iron complex transport system substrate-binding protein